MSSELTSPGRTLADALPPKGLPTTRIIEARYGESNCVCGRPAISCGYCSAECLEREEAKAEAAKKESTAIQACRLFMGVYQSNDFGGATMHGHGCDLGPAIELAEKAVKDGSLASPTPNRRTLYALGTNIDGEAKLLNVQLHGPDSFIVWTNKEAAADYQRRFAAGEQYAVVEVM